MAEAGLRVEVTAEQIDRSTYRDSRRCMIAEAIREARPTWTNILVDLQTIRWTNPRTKMRCVSLTSETAAAALVNFDQGRPIEPFAFRLRTFQRTPLLQRETKAEHDQLVIDGTNTTTHPRTKSARKRTVEVGARGAGEVVVIGGRPMRGGHLRGAAKNATSGRKVDRDQPTSKASNITLSRTGARVFGRRLLRG